MEYRYHDLLNNILSSFYFKIWKKVHKTSLDHNP